MVGIIYVYVDMVFGFYGYGCFGMIAVLSVLHACVFVFLYLHLFWIKNPYCERGCGIL